MTFFEGGACARVGLRLVCSQKLSLIKAYVAVTTMVVRYVFGRRAHYFEARLMSEGPIAIARVLLKF